MDVELFENPVFPLKNDRPLCFYKTSVNGKMCMYDAFYDEKIRWEMILNRIKYRGGFISSEDVLTAMNVTRVCRQPSWFSKSFAKELILSYCTSKVIVDPFAGWGTRFDAAIELGKTYIGLDANKTLVDWHHSHGRDIQYGDIEDNRYIGGCSVFTCPPYGDTEVYFNGMKLKSESEWIDLVMSNVPNAHEYVFVCGDVRDDLKKYIVSKKVNKSHFGTNEEYIIVIKNEFDSKSSELPRSFERNTVDVIDKYGNVLKVSIHQVDDLLCNGFYLVN